MIFDNRQHAGRELAQALQPYRNAHPLIIALPRGGVVVAAEVAQALQAPLDVLVVRKIGAPDQEELAVGALGPQGVHVLNQPLIARLRIAPHRLEAVIAQETEEMARRTRLYRGNDGAMPHVENETVIIVDDGLATGATALAAIRALRLGHPKALILAVPVCARETAEQLRHEVEALVCVTQPRNLDAVGAWYQDFRQTDDAEVLRLLHQAAGQKQ